MWLAISTARRRLTYLFAVALPIRFAFAIDNGWSSVAGNEEALHHYGEHTTRLDDAHAWLKGFFKGLTKRRIPQWFIERWFSEAHATKQPMASPNTASQPTTEDTSEGTPVMSLSNAESNAHHNRYSYLAIALMIGVPMLTYLIAVIQSIELRDALHQNGAELRVHDAALGVILFLMRIGSIILTAIGAVVAFFGSPKNSAPRWMIRRRQER